MSHDKILGTPLQERCIHAPQDRLRALFEAEGFRCDALTVREKTVENRALNLRMPRRWIQAVFTRIGGEPAAQADAARSARGDSATPSPTVSSLRDADSRTSEQAFSCTATDASVHDAMTGEAVATETEQQRAAAADADRSPDDGCDNSGGVNEWDATPEEGVLGSDVGGLFQEPPEMVQEAITLAPSFTVKASIPIIVRGNGTFPTQCHARWISA